ncbi:hypothetical protein [Actinoplanes sp. URMC 104]|uniref:hypothetical protein n=1 Tax=Actinoplanes sp. URMC 104 TaxID=3423409 RepID=UPI003F1B1601
MTGYIAAGARGRATAHATNTGFRLRRVVDIRFRPAPSPGAQHSFELIGDCGHVIDVDSWSGLQESDLDRHRQLHIGGRRKRCRRCPIVPAQRNARS